LSSDVREFVTKLNEEYEQWLLPKIAQPDEGSTEDIGGRDGFAEGDLTLTRVRQYREN